MIISAKGHEMASTEHHKALPDDLLLFLEEDDELEESTSTSEEELAVWPIPDSSRAPLDDPALREVTGRRPTLPAQWFDDEEPEARPVLDDDDDTAESVDELLVAQHYLFDAETESS
jgi:hypothetical protein